MESHSVDIDLTAHLKILYAAYRHTNDIDAKGTFFSPFCYQICRPQPSFAARDRETIIRYLHETAPKRDSTRQKTKGYYTIRPLVETEFEFGTDEQVAPAGFPSAESIKEKARAEGWVGMRVDLWNESAGLEEEEDNSLMVKVQYWWRKEGELWLQIFHDIMYMDAKDGTQGLEGNVLE
ncbi:monocarboxylate permease-like protein [Colletotrichum truncatum]|uniref:Monocarboxylate permease-like protein n=1 Tax=Colletotrichum truncatum TaxID=5467 RepID=A0ACC3Z7J7_COLTU|nr:monocarboxylate permease-like protein [Colletotrichum truncatum]KAF6782963.1 monocarboxylate permease-like protein [Colletotrichum truncatum]